MPLCIVQQKSTLKIFGLNPSHGLNMVDHNIYTHTFSMGINEVTFTFAVLLLYSVKETLKDGLNISRCIYAPSVFCLYTVRLYPVTDHHRR